MAKRLGEDDEEFFFEDRSLSVSLDEEVVLESVTRIGGEVSRLRAEVDELLEQNAILLDSFAKLKQLIAEKQSIQLEDFELACETTTQGSSEETRKESIKKIAH